MRRKEEMMMKREVIWGVRRGYQRELCGRLGEAGRHKGTPEAER